MQFQSEIFQYAQAHGPQTALRDALGAMDFKSLIERSEERFHLLFGALGLEFGGYSGVKPPLGMSDVAGTHPTFPRAGMHPTFPKAATPLVAGDVVAFCGPPGRELVINCLACQLAGIVFQPLDARLPDTVLRQQVRTSGARLVLAETDAIHARFGDDIPVVIPGVMPVVIPGVVPGVISRADHPSGAMAPQAATRNGGDPQLWSAARHPDSARALLYSTSGSTGAPKIIPHSRASLRECGQKTVETCGLGPGDIMAHTSGIWLETLLAGLAAGASVCCLNAATVRKGALVNWLAREKVNVLPVYPALFRVICAEAGERRLPDLRAVFLSGEAVTSGDIQAFENLCVTGARVINCYASQEILWMAHSIHEHGARPIPKRMPTAIISPQAGLSIRSQDGAHPLAPGEVGEICATSVHVPMEYCANPAASKAAITQMPDGRRRFRTGDLGIIDAAGQLQVVGRADAEIKVNGFRVSPLEVEAVMAPLSGQRALVVVNLPCARGLNRLVCFFSGEVAPSELKRAAAKVLPPWMVPVIFVKQDRLARTETGKLRRNGYVLPADTGRADEDRIRPGRETEIAELWRRLLGHDNFGANDSFFERGGDSLRGVELLIGLEKIAANKNASLSLDDILLNGATLRQCTHLVAGLDGAGSDGTGPDGTGSDGAGPDGTGPDGTGPDETGADGTGPDGTGPDERRAGADTGFDAARSHVTLLHPGPISLGAPRPAPELICLHVYSGDVSDYTALASELGAFHRVSGIAARYFGRSRAYSLKKKIEEAQVTLLESRAAREDAREGAGDVILVGYSYGGPLAAGLAQKLAQKLDQRLAKHKKHRIRGLVLIEPVAFFAHSRPYRLMRALGALAESVLPSRRPRGKERAYPGDWLYAVGVPAGLPVLLVKGDSYPARACAGWRAISDARVVGVGGSHKEIMQGMHAQATARAIKDWVSGLPMSEPEQ